MCLHCIFFFASPLHQSLKPKKIRPVYKHATLCFWFYYQSKYYILYTCRFELKNNWSTIKPLANYFPSYKKDLRCHGRQIQYSLSARASSIQIHRYGARRYYKVGVGDQSTQGHLRLLFGEFSFVTFVAVVYDFKTCIVMKERNQCHQKQSRMQNPFPLKIISEICESTFTTPLHSTHLTGPLWHAQLLRHRRKRVQSESSIQLVREDALSLRATSWKTRDLKTLEFSPFSWACVTDRPPAVYLTSQSPVYRTLRTS